MQNMHWHNAFQFPIWRGPDSPNDILKVWEAFCWELAKVGIHIMNIDHKGNQDWQICVELKKLMGEKLMEKLALVRAQAVVYGVCSQYPISPQSGADSFFSVNHRAKGWPLPHRWHNGKSCRGGGTAATANATANLHKKHPCWVGFWWRRGLCVKLCSLALGSGG